jgi:hypothetical protein
MMAASGLSTLLGLAIQVALLVVSLTVVRRHKPHAVAPLASSFAVNLVATLLGVVAYPVAGMMADRSGGVESFMVVQSALTVGFALVHMVAGVLLVLGLVKLATPDPAPAAGDGVSAGR